jgi:hypothetical protein
MPKVGRFGARYRISSLCGSISVGPRANPQLTVAGGCGVRERGQCRAWGTWSPRCSGKGGLAGETENRTARARYRWDLGETPSWRQQGVVACGREASCGPGGPEARYAWGGPVWRAKQKSTRLGLISVEPLGNRLQMAVGPCWMQWKARSNAQGERRARYAQRGGLLIGVNQ